MSLFSNKHKKSKFSRKTILKIKKKKYRKPISFLNRQKNNAKFKAIKKKRNSSIRKLSKLFAYNTETKLPNIVNIYTILAVVLFVIISLAYFFFFTSYFKVTTIQVYEGDQLTSNMQIRKLVEPLRNQNMIFIESNKISSLLSKEIDNMAEIKIHKQYPKTIAIYYRKFEDIANLIGYNQLLKQETKYILNETGVITEVDRYKPDLPLIKIYTEKNYQLGDQVISQEKINYILASIELFKSKFDMEISGTTYLPTAREVHLTTDRGFKVWLDMTQDYEKQLQKLKNAIPKIDIYSQQFQYIDLRIESANGDKIIFKRA